MDIGLKLLLAKGKILSMKWRIKLTREELEEKRPTAKAFIDGANDVEIDLDEVYNVIDDLETELRIQGREINRCLQINGQLKQRIEELEHEIKFKNVDL
jgi:predicted nuclease with TOPRIM domain